MSSERLSIVIEVDTKTGQAKIRELDRELTKLGDTTDKTAAATDKLSGGINKLSGALGALGIGITVRELSQLADHYKQVTGRLALVTNGAQDFARANQALIDIARQTRSDWGEAVGLYNRLAIATREMGLSQESLLTVTKAVNQAIIVSGASAQEAQAALIQLGQGLASGTLRGEELNSVLEQTPRLARMIAEGMGVTVGQLRQLGAEGKLTAEAVVAAIQRQAGAIQGEFERMPATIGQAITQVSNAFELWLGEQDRAHNVSQRVADVLLIVADNMDTAARGTIAFATALATLKAQAMLAARGMGTLAVAVRGVGAAFVGWQIGDWLRSQYPAVEQFGTTVIALLDKLVTNIKVLGRRMAIELGLVMADPLAAIRERIAGIAQSVAEALRVVGFDGWARKMDGVAGALHSGTQAAQQYRAEIARLNKERERELKIIDMAAVSMMRESMQRKHAAAQAPTAPQQQAGGNVPLPVVHTAQAVAQDTLAIVEQYKRRAEAVHNVTAAMYQDEIDLLLAKQEQRALLLDEQRQREIERVQQQIQDKQLQREAILAINQEYDDREAQLAMQTAERINRIEMDRAKKQLAIEKQAQQARLQLTGGALNTLANLLAQGGRKAFEASKALAIAQTVVSTYSAAQKAYESQLSIPTPDAPIRAAVAAGIAIAQGVARVAAISSQQYGGASVGGAAGGGGGVSMSPGTAATRAGYGTPQPIGSASQQQAQQPVQINLQVQALHPEALSPDVLQRIADTLAPALHDTLARGGQNVAVAL